MAHLWVDDLDQFSEKVFLGYLDMEAVAAVLHACLQHRQGEVDYVKVLSSSRKTLLQSRNSLFGSVHKKHTGSTHSLLHPHAQNIIHANAAPIHYIALPTVNALSIQRIRLPTYLY